MAKRSQTIVYTALMYILITIVYILVGYVSLEHRLMRKLRIVPFSYSAVSSIMATELLDALPSDNGAYKLNIIGGDMYEGTKYIYIYSLKSDIKFLSSKYTYTSYLIAGSCIDKEEFGDYFVSCFSDNSDIISVSLIAGMATGGSIGSAIFGTIVVGAVAGGCSLSYMFKDYIEKLNKEEIIQTALFRTYSYVCDVSNAAIKDAGLGLCKGDNWFVPIVISHITPNIEDTRERQIELVSGKIQKIDGGSDCSLWYNTLEVPNKANYLEVTKERNKIKIKAAYRYIK